MLDGKDGLEAFYSILIGGVPVVELIQRLWGIAVTGSERMPACKLVAEVLEMPWTPETHQDWIWELDGVMSRVMELTDAEL